LGESLEVTPATTVDLPVPARAEIAIEGIIDPTRTDMDGPFSEGDGYYGQSRSCYTIQVKAITMRRDAIYHELDPIHPEHNLVGLLSREANLYEALKETVPGFKAAHIGPDGQCAKFLVYLSIKKSRDEDVRVAGLAALDNTFNNLAVVVDEDVDVYDESEVAWAVATRATHGSDIYAVPDSQPAKFIIDATAPRDESFPTRVTFPPELWDSIRVEDYLR